MEHDNIGDDDIKYNDQSSILATEHPNSFNNAHNSSNQNDRKNQINDGDIKKEDDKKPPKKKHRKKTNKGVNCKSLYKISRKLTREILNMIVASIDADGIYTFMIDKLAVLTINNGICQLQNGDRIVNFGFRHKITNEVLYAYAYKIDPAINRSYEWSFDVVLYTIANIKDKCGINDKQLLQSLILNDFNINNIPKLKNKDIKPLIDNSKSLAKINVCNINNKDTNKRKLTLALTVEQFKKNLTKYFDAYGNNVAKLIPILICGENKKYCVEYVWIMTIEPGFDIGISFKSLKCQSNCKTVTRIYVDKQILLRYHMLLNLHECHCLDNKFLSNITCLHIGNVSENENKLKDLQQKHKKIKTENTYLKNNVNDLKMAMTNMEQELKKLNILISTFPKDNIIETHQNEESEATLLQDTTAQPNHDDDEISPVLADNNVSQPTSTPITPSVVTHGNILSTPNLTTMSSFRSQPYVIPIYYFPPPEYWNQQISRN